MNLDELGITGLGDEELEAHEKSAEAEVDTFAEMQAQLNALREQNEKLAERMAAPAVVREEVVDDGAFIDPEDDRKNWPVIHINDEDGKPNYEFLITSGTKKDGKPFIHRLQVQRNEDVAVPPSIVDALRCAVQDKVVHDQHPVTGKTIERVKKQPSVSWYLVSGGKYVK